MEIPYKMNSNEFLQFREKLADGVFNNFKKVTAITNLYLTSKIGIELNTLVPVNLPSTEHTAIYEPDRLYYDKPNNTYISIDYYYEGLNTPALAVFNSCNEIIKYHFNLHQDLAVDLNEFKFPTIVPIVINFNENIVLTDYYSSAKNAKNFVNIEYHAFNLNRTTVKNSLDKAPTIVSLYLSHINDYDEFIQEATALFSMASEEVREKSLELITSIGYEDLAKFLAHKVDNQIKHRLSEEDKSEATKRYNLAKQLLAEGDTAVEDIAKAVGLTTFEVSLVKLMSRL
ncbi:MAG: hypothetical protein ATN36_06460 [Epulopiscium sp. Nele67-Bin005]|nr:MAG: hypothetical protein ATN36_06460 [Epulopiscium sp. Nele67-Bin005]